jgi:5-methylcytosine-specific restriction enzyme B
MLEIINLRIEALYDRDHCLGHAYFLGIAPGAEDAFQQLGQVFRGKIIPLLQEYFFEDWRKIQLVLGDNQKQSDKYRFVKAIEQDGDLQALFGSDHGLDPYGDGVRPRYELNTMAFDEPLAYIQIYQR